MLRLDAVVADGRAEGGDESVVWGRAAGDVGRIVDSSPCEMAAVGRDVTVAALDSPSYGDGLRDCFALNCSSNATSRSRVEEVRLGLVVESVSALPRRPSLSRKRSSRSLARVG